MCATYVLLLSILGLAIHSQAQDCPAPAIGENMHLNDPVIGTHAFQDGDKVSFGCLLGYIPAGGSAVITCTAGSWSPLRMTCERRNCGASDKDVLNGYIDYPEGTEFGDALVVTCNTGFHLVGKDKIICGVQGWMDRLPECEVVICSPPLLGEAFGFSPIKETYNYREVIEYQCQKDYTLSGAKTLSCSENGTFPPTPPTCVKVQCKDPIVKNGNWVDGSRPPYKHKSTVILKCISGFTMTGASTQTCELNNEWSPGLPTCQPAAAVQCDEPKVPNADRVEGSPPPYKHKSTVTFKCISGYTMTGASTQTCGLDGKWSPGPPTCRLMPSPTRPSTTKKTIVRPGSTDPPPGNNGNSNVTWWVLGLTAVGIVLTCCGCYFCGVLTIIKKKLRSFRSSPDTVVPKEEEIALA